MKNKSLITALLSALAIMGIHTTHINANAGRGALAGIIPGTIIGGAFGGGKGAAIGAATGLAFGALAGSAVDRSNDIGTPIDTAGFFYWSVINNTDSDIEVRGSSVRDFVLIPGGSEANIARGNSFKFYAKFAGGKKRRPASIIASSHVIEIKQSPNGNLYFDNYND